MIDNAANGVIRKTGDDDYEIVFVRRLGKPIEKVWAALTDPARLADWFAQTEVDLRLGGEMRFRWALHGSTETAVIVALDPPKLLAWATPIAEGRHSVVRWDLMSETGAVKKGTRLILTQTLIAPDDLLSIATGWHVHLYDLADAARRDTPGAWTLERERERSERERTNLVPYYRERLPPDASHVPWRH